MIILTGTEFGDYIQNSVLHKRPYRLGELPKKLEVLGVHYELLGLVGYKPGHYIAYTRQADNRWVVLDDMKTRSSICTQRVKVNPALIVYFKV